MVEDLARRASARARAGRRLGPQTGVGQAAPAMVGERTLAWVLCLLAACDGSRSQAPSEERGRDAGDGALETDAGGPTEPAPPMAPVAPSEVDQTPCPEGWEAWSPDGAATVCQPWPAEEPSAECVTGQARFPGEAECTLIGSACPAGFPEGLPADGVLYVQAGRDADGTGTRDDPLGSLGDAVARAEEGTVIALSAGRYEEPVRLGRGITLRGACPTQTVIASQSASRTEGTITVEGTDVTIADVQLRGPRPGIWVEAAASVRVEGVMIEEAQFLGVAINGGSMTARSLSIRDTQPLPDGRFGRGVEIVEPGRLTMDRAVIEQSHGGGIMADGSGAELVARQVALRDTGLGDLESVGVAVQSGASAELSAFVASGTAHIGLLAGGEGAVVSVEHLVIRDTTGGARARAVTLVEGAVGTIADVLVQRSAGLGVALSRVGTSVHLTDLAVLDTTDDDGEERAVNVQRGAQLELDRALLHENTDAAIAVIDGGDLSASDVTISAMRPPSRAELGGGLLIRGPADATVERLAIDHPYRTGVLVQGAGAVLDASDVTVLDTQNIDGGARGLYVINGGAATVTRARLERSQEIGVLITGQDAEATLTDVHVRDSLPQPDTGQFGRGVGVQLGGALVGHRLLIEQNREIGVYAAGEGALAQLHELAIVDTLRSGCPSPPCSDGTGGMGLGAYHGATLEVAFFSVRASALCGAQVVDATLRLEGGEIVQSPIGLNVQAPDAELNALVERLTTDVRFVDNERNIDSAQLPIPVLLEE